VLFRSAVAVRAISEGKIIPVEYRGLTEVNVKENDLTPEETYAQVNKTQLLDDVARAIRSETMIFTNYGREQSTIIEHMMDNVRHEEEGEKAEWKKQTVNDHYFHAVAFMLASKKLADFLIANDKNDVRSLVMANNVDIKKRSNDNLGSNTGDNRIWRQTHLL
jgi:predicted ATPase